MWPAGAASLLVLSAYVLLWGRVLWNERRYGLRAAAVIASFTALGKFPQAVGVARFLGNRLMRRRSTLIEYKGAKRPAGE
jgi:hypothetical protein